MKAILLGLLLGPLFSMAQECKLIRETDVYTKEARISTGFMKLQGGTSLSIDADSKEIDFFFSIPDKCFNDASTVFIFFEGSKVRTTYRNAGSVNCDGNFHFKYRNNLNPNTVLQKLGTLNVVHFIFTGNDKKEYLVALLPDQQKILKESAACIIEESKKLVK